MINFQKFDNESAPVYGEGWDVAKHGHFSVIILPSFLLLPSFLDFRSINYFSTAPGVSFSFLRNIFHFLFRLVNFCSIILFPGSCM